MNKKNFPQNDRKFLVLYGWGTRIRTLEWGIQSPLPYHLAIPQNTDDRLIFESEITYDDPCVSSLGYTQSGARQSGGIL